MEQKNNDSYLTIKTEKNNSKNVERSRFLGHIKKVYTQDQAREFIKDIKERYSDASHNCSAYVTGMDRQFQFADDNGEPGGTAGRPILGAILSSGVTNVCLVVTRYFGGKKLGIRGLIDAYGSTARELLDSCGVVTEVVHRPAVLYCDYAKVDRVQYLLDTLGVLITHREYREKVKFVISVRESHYDKCINRLRPLADIFPDRKN